MRRRWTLVMVMVSLLALTGCIDQTPAQLPNQEPTTSTEAIPESTPVSEPAPIMAPSAPTLAPRVKPDITLPAGKGAFYGRVTWGDKHVENGEVVAHTLNPALVLFSFSDSDRLVAHTDTDGSYVLVVDADSYYIGCALPDSKYLTYKTSGFVSGLVGARNYEVVDGDFTLVDLEANDWSIELISPGSQGSKPTLKTNTPTLTWQPYDWARYDGRAGYYEVEVGIIKDGYHVVLKEKANQESYSLVNPLESGEYRWEVRAFSSSGLEIGGTISEYGFFVPSSVVAPRSSSPESSMQTQVIVTMPDINSIIDLDGKKIGMGTTQFQYAEAALSTYNIESTTVAIPSKELWLALKQGVVDAVLISDHPSSDLQALVDTLDARILPWSNQAIQALTDQFPEAAATVLPAGTYSGQDSDVLGFTIYQ